MPLLGRVSNIFLVLALAGNADYLVTGDRDLLSLVDHFDCPILTAEAFFRVIES